jgi:hypothetical protein
MLFLPKLNTLSSDMPVKLTMRSIMFVLIDNFWHFTSDPNALVSNLAIGGDWKHRPISVAVSADC